MLQWFPRNWLRCGLIVWLAWVVNAVMLGKTVAADARPNVLLVITDDQGYGDLGTHGNPRLQTPHLDRLAADSLQMTQFQVCPVCSPTRASLMTGRYNYRTGVVDTYIGRSMMHADEVTLAEMLAETGYRTGIFGKWHLGDNYPLRAMDQGFQESLVIKGGGLGQPADPPGGSKYFDPQLLHNGKYVATKGYCSDVYTDAAIGFMEQQAATPDTPFFAYVAFNAPHDPLEAPPELYAKYKQLNLAHDQFPQGGVPLAGTADQDALAKIYAMVENIDQNIGRMLGKLDELKLTDNTIVIFMTDNGPAGVRYNGGMRGTKGTVYQGGIRVPCFVRWPARIKPRQVDYPAAHIDMVPTLRAACGVVRPVANVLDGQNLLPLWEDQPFERVERALLTQWHRGDVPEMGRAFAIRRGDWKLLQPKGVPPGEFKATGKLELYHLAEDPHEQHDLSQQQPDRVAAMLAEYQAWFQDVASTRDFAPPRIILDLEKENPVLLTRQDWRGPRAGWDKNSNGHWLLTVAKAGKYRVKLTFPAGKGVATVEAGSAKGGVVADIPVTTTAGECQVMLNLPAGDATFTARMNYEHDAFEQAQSPGVHYVEISHVE